ncbi:unnamed protein product [Rangifer tarandus platyrhynchus]|uniref:Uncharacterized protein n=1 Tax=Rangifer tarandus platyrhynchus TaxID=3082113 RepID=A0AC59Z5V0_RANTA
MHGALPGDGQKPRVLEWKVPAGEGGARPLMRGEPQADDWAESRNIRKLEMPAAKLQSPPGSAEDYGVLRAHAGEEGSGDDHGTAKTTLSSSLGKCRPPQTCSRHCSPHEPKEAPATTPGRHSQHIPWCAPFSAVREERPVPRCLSGTSIQCEFQPELIHLPPGP